MAARACVVQIVPLPCLPGLLSLEQIPSNKSLRGGSTKESYEIRCLSLRGTHRVPRKRLPSCARFRGSLKG